METCSDRGLDRIHQLERGQEVGEAACRRLGLTSRFLSFTLILEREQVFVGQRGKGRQPNGEGSEEDHVLHYRRPRK